jgi:hypothetical protein
MEERTEHSVVEGVGKLKTTSGAVAVKYRFDLYRSVAVQGGQVIGRGLRECTGTVELVSDQSMIPNGHWHLELASGEQWTIQNDNGRWVRVADAK